MTFIVMFCDNFAHKWRRLNGEIGTLSWLFRENAEAMGANSISLFNCSSFMYMLELR